MSLAGCLHMAWRYVVHHQVRTLLLALALGLTLALPLAVRGLLRLAQQEWRARAESTPLVLGAKGSALELTLQSLYFRRRGAETIPANSAETVRATGLAEAIPLHVRFHAQETPIVGTTFEYFDFRRCRVASGRLMGRLGECVLGSGVARTRGLKVGDTLMSSPEQVFDIAGVYPLKMHIVGVLEETHTADDHAIFVDIKTAWLIEGIAHGHEDVLQSKDTGQVMERQADNVVAGKGLRLYAEVTAENARSFHFHGDPRTYPVSSVLVIPKDARAQALLLGRYQSTPDGLQLVLPAAEMDALFATLLKAERFALLLLLVLGLAVFLIITLVFALSFRLRHREFATLEDIGIRHGTVALVKACEIVLVGLASLAVVAAMWWLVQRYGVVLIRAGVR